MTRFPGPGSDAAIGPDGGFFSRWVSGKVPYRLADPAQFVLSESATVLTSTVWKEKGKVVNGIMLYGGFSLKSTELGGYGSEIHCVRKK